MSRLIIIGASGHGKVIADIAARCGYTDIAFLDDNPNIRECMGYPVIGKVKGAKEYPGAKFIVAIGNPEIRQKIQGQMNINLKGNYFMVKAYIEYLESLDDKNGNVVVITSERSRRSDDIPYGLTKAASNSFIECFASKVISEGIRVNGVAPGVTASDMTGVDRNGNMYANWQPSNRFFLPEEVAEVVNFLLSDVSNCISGEIIACDQGRYISHW